jgi:predicted O-methyltransferase YrrM
MKISRPTLLVSVVLLIVGSSQTVLAEPRQATSQPSIPYVATRLDMARDMLWMANVVKDDVVYDLGSGDGRIVIAAVRDFGARRAVGIEHDPERIRESRANTAKAGVADRVQFIEADLFTSDFSQASVVALFLGHRPNIQLRAKLLNSVKPGTRIVSHQFAMGEWEPDKALTARTVFMGMWGEIMTPFINNPNVPDYTGNESHFGRSDKIAMWTVPAAVAGIWRGKVRTSEGPQDIRIVFHQRISEVDGSYELTGPKKSRGSAQVDLWGDHLRWRCEPREMGPGQPEMRFDGHVQGNEMKGTMAVFDNSQIREEPWQARRDPADLIGTWEWPCPYGPRTVRLSIARRDNRLTATYQDVTETPITDFYDWGGGFYFTLLVGRYADGSLPITEETGWLIGAGVVDGDSLKGTIAFYPSEESPLKDGRRGPTPARRLWTARRLEP